MKKTPPCDACGEPSRVFMQDIAFGLDTVYYYYCDRCLDNKEYREVIEVRHVRSKC